MSEQSHYSKYGRSHYEANKEAYSDRSKRQRIKLRSWYRELKSKPCERCAHEGHPGAMHFHHRDPTTKKFMLSNAYMVRGRQAVLDEIAKCELLCADCHASEHDMV